MRSVLIEFHGWRGFSAGCDLFFWIVCLGFFSVALSRYLVSERLKELKENLQVLTRGDES